MDSDDPTQPIQLLTPDGRLVEHPQFRWEGSDEQLVTMLRQMRRGRRLDIEGAALQRHGELGLWPPMMGQEGYQAGAAAVLTPQDMVFATYRDQLLALARGVGLPELLALWRGSGLSRWDSATLQLAPYSLIIGSHPLHAVGYAMGIAYDKAHHPDDRANDAVSFVCYGDGASSQGDTSEALVFAAAYRAPVVFCCVNNQWAISEPTAVQAPIPLYQRAFGFGIPGIRVDGNDPLASQAVLGWAFEHARSGKGPVLVEALTYRMGPHTTSDDPTKYRPAELTEQWRAKDPIDRLQKLLLRRQIIDQGWLDVMDAELDDFGAQIRTTCHELPDTPVEEVFDNVVAHPGLDLLEQRAETLGWIATPPSEGDRA
ncbi:pyruvate dehydrogenase E1 component alpha subunit [Propionibacterium cyclohexanicum]|uniref:2-oxoisovalerate dehydrogenase subunit alpha n=1 Tax=Propionibacterium cyclohexanicum TaxID=64702 RepID=A0A1H9T3R5_9ACTN|nr:thiamine pyrophosphate-dependent dehydrogenase E1 component subunit alpha [Propionibacterium cyclohexanicum]SER91756.1 pyruvate dehydrogenase E1 component alpha subunit [Propionibacterium cyclohexanicum]